MSSDKLPGQEKITEADDDTEPLQAFIPMSS